MSKKQYDTNSNDPANNPDEFLDKKDVTISVTNSDEHVNFNTATDNPELLPDNKCTAKGLISAYEQISGNRWIRYAAHGCALDPWFILHVILEYSPKRYRTCVAGFRIHDNSRTRCNNNGK